MTFGNQRLEEEYTQWLPKKTQRLCECVDTQPKCPCAGAEEARRSFLTYASPLQLKEGHFQRASIFSKPAGAQVTHLFLSWW